MLLIDQLRDEFAKNRVLVGFDLYSLDRRFSQISPKTSNDSVVHFFKG